VMMVDMLNCGLRSAECGVLLVIAE
jgi:hypothetical protein